MALELTRFQRQFSEDQLETVWRFSGIGYDPETGVSYPFPGGRVMMRFLQPIPGSWRDILRRAIRTGDKGAARALMLAILRQLRPHRRIPARRLSAAPVRLVSQTHIRTDAPTRGSPFPGTRLRRRGPDMN
jgi:hypothetical protein